MLKKLLLACQNKKLVAISRLKIVSKDLKDKELRDKKELEDAKNNKDRNLKSIRDLMLRAYKSDIRAAFKILTAHSRKSKESSMLEKQM